MCQPNAHLHALRGQGGRVPEGGVSHLVRRLADEVDTLAHVEVLSGAGELLARWCRECRADQVRGEPHGLTCGIGLLLSEAQEVCGPTSSRT